jgi:mycofactocin precursor
MENQSTLTDRDDAVVTDDDADLGAEVADELLIEEISIDGMCGVY